MAHYVKPLHIAPMKAGEALEAHRIVIIGTNDDEVIYPANAEDTQIVGITLHAAASGEPVDVVTFGFALLKVDGNAANIIYGDSISVHNTSGYGEKATGGAAANVECVGYAEEASTADGDLISVRVSKHLKWFAA